jgi:hypothetical protein
MKLKERAILMTKAVHGMAMISRLTVDGLTRAEINIIVQTLYDLALNIQDYYKDE